jgi:hypothetical protein
VNALAPVALSPGASVTATLQVTSPAGAANSSNAINATVTNQAAATYSRLASTTYVIANTAPGAPTIGSATAGNAQATVSFTPPASNGGSPITSYTVTASPGGRTASGTASPLTVTGLTNGTAYTFAVTATNAVGTGAASAASNSVTPAGTSPGILWSANHESGNFSEWSADGGGMAQGFRNYVADTTGTVKVEVSTAQAQSGTRSARLEMPQGTGNQAQLIRWRESQTNADLYYSVWLYFPQNIDTRGGGWFNLLQIHTKNGGWTIPIGIEVKTQANGTNTFFLHSPYSTTSAWNTGGMPYWEYTSTVPIPIGRWFNVELRFKRDPSQGVVQFWQEGAQIFNVQNVQTTHAGATYHEFYVNIYGLGISPSPTVIYVDNVTISRTRIGP